ncbi:GH92 family glycosyl hydrolase [Streptomyces collinus]|uniref:Alpha-1,2-mannosidase n=1 Tax=Streptomyces collinus (strain DSM 40733 / Tue 365) TaxID=1214242 RepID=S5VR81_STRC3|nr:GH92 family glycosyl hydrolase [Streptomyces collinus]AGS73157.1 alpha-1,2-mannosidase [Streptomyces collinus Tu 365]UJA11823.1 glycoside hydrolase family 92 protein [Streptomyces collinus]UJA13311.1 glycoside hydrolase family 92 protein [Streptomyces collinus]
MRGTRRTRLCLAGVMAASALIATPAARAAERTDGHLTDLVNPFIGSQNEGNTFPGATVPFGMVQLSPDTGHSTGYDYTQNRVRGFSLVHLSGVGCRIGGDLPVLPTTGEVTQTDYARYAAGFSHADEQASPGYYGVGLDSGIRAELTATARTGVQRYTFPATDRANVLLNAAQALHKPVASSVEILDAHTVRTEITGHGFCRDTGPYTVYTITRFNRPFTAYGTWDGAAVTPGARTGRGGAYVRFDTTKDRTVEATTALSYVDARGAAVNLRAGGGRSFDAVRRRAREEWERRLAAVRVRGGDPTLRRTFYSSLYRSFLAPNIGSDADGRYLGWDRRVHRAERFTYYQNWSLWDTYRTQAQLLALLAPREARDMALSVVKVDEDGGWLPKWGYGPVETNCMSGDPVTPFLTTAYQTGLLRGFEERAYRALRKNADGVPPAGYPGIGREANAEYIAHGYAPFVKDRPLSKLGDSDYHHGASVTLEYALADAVLAQMARGLGHDADAARYAARSRNYRTLFDPSTGFFRARDASGAFTGPADPARSTGFHEGTAWQYQWLVPQDLPGMIDLIGGTRAANERLDTFFAYDRLLADPARTAREVWVHGDAYDYYNADKYNPMNEPDLVAPYTYLATGQPWKTTDVVHAALTLFTDGPTGMTGNDDLGTMSAWNVLSSIGLFPIQPGYNTWGLSTPVFDRVDLTLDRRYWPGGGFTVTAPGTSAADRYVQSVRTDGRPHARTYLTTDALRSLRTVAFTVGPRPSEWGTSPQAAPPVLK